MTGRLAPSKGELSWLPSTLPDERARLCLRFQASIIQDPDTGRPSGKRRAMTASAWTWACGTGLTARSEEHTSELQSLMRTSYAVFCLKKQQQQKHKQTIMTK